MRCEEVREIVVDKLSGALTAAEESRLQEHLAQCAACRDEWAELGSIWADMEHIRVPQMEHIDIRMNVLAAAAAPGWNLFRWRLDMREIVKAAAIIVIVAGLAAGASLFLGKRTEPRPVLDASAHIRGSRTATITLVEYGDYECPPCFRNEGIIRRLLEKYPNTLKFEFRHFPLMGPHPHALAAAKAADAAGQQGKFWEMHDVLMTSREQWSRVSDVEPFFIDQAKLLGLDVNLFRESFRAPETEQRILKQRALAEASGIGATPTFLINDRKIEPTPENFEGFDSLIVEELQRLKKSRADGH
jgi:protein-disulfide isomerase